MGGLKKFVFVVCGGKEHIETLHFSLKALKKYSLLPILVITDSSRNETTIEHDNVIDIRTPEHFNNHQASIFLKTGIYKFLPFDGDELYCYLDTDVVALKIKVDEIFDFYSSPISFSTDHCKMDSFSPYAIKCKCINENKADELNKLISEFEDKYSYLFNKKQGKEIQLLLNTINRIRNDEDKPLSDTKDKNYKTTIRFFKAIKHWKNEFYQNDTIQKKRQLLHSLTSINDNSILQLIYNYLFVVPKYFKRNLFKKVWYDKEGNKIYDRDSDFYLYMKKNGFYLNKDNDNTFRWYHETTGLVKHQELQDFDNFLSQKGIFLDKKIGCYVNNKGEIVYPNIPMLVQNNSTFRFNFDTGIWYDENNKKVFELQCHHLKEAIYNKFNIEITEVNWQHWNGGVFLFDKESINFLNTWHDFTLDIFKDPYWETRDQGTLIATAWKFQLQNHPTLPIVFNFLADYNHPTMQYCGNLTFNIDECHKNIIPNFIHIYHHWGDEKWQVWKDVKKRILENVEGR